MNLHPPEPARTQIEVLTNSELCRELMCCMLDDIPYRGDGHYWNVVKSKPRWNPELKHYTHTFDLVETRLRDWR